jgi:hypothetical protein
MVWAEQKQLSLILPSDVEVGDGRNYIIIGEDVPEEIADQMSAAIVFRNSRADLPRGAPTSDSTFVIYFALGITKAERLELVCYSQRAESGGTFTYHRQTIFSIERPDGIGTATRPTMRIGYNTSTLQSFVDEDVNVWAELRGLIVGNPNPTYVADPAIWMEFTRFAQLRARNGSTVIPFDFESPIRLPMTTDGDASESSTKHPYQIGPDGGLNYIHDDNEGVYRNNGVIVDYDAKVNQHVHPSSTNGWVDLTPSGTGWSGSIFQYRRYRGLIWVRCSLSRASWVAGQLMHTGFTGNSAPDASVYIPFSNSNGEALLTTDGRLTIVAAGSGNVRFYACFPSATGE